MLKVGERLTLECVDGEGCAGCTFNGKSELGFFSCKATLCGKHDREDETPVIFKTVQLSSPEQPKTMSTTERTSLRDFFAGQASEEDIADMQSSKPSGYISRQCARYMHADAMLAEREKHI